MLERIRAEYLASLSGYVDQLNDALTDLDPAAQEQARRIAHRLRGSGASYGFPEISEAAAAVEDAPAESLQSHLESLVEVLRAPRQAAGDRALLLIVSDDRAFGDQLRERLAAPDRRLLVVRSGAAALRAARSSTPALIVLELLLPDLDGRALLERLSQLPNLERVPIVAVASRGNARLREECFALGADQYFDKACDLALIATTADSALKAMLRAASSTQMRLMSRLLSQAAFQSLYERGSGGRGSRSRCLALLELGNLPESDGDPLLHRVAGLILKHARIGDAVGRWGENRLALLLQDATPHGGHAALRRLKATLEEEVFQANGRSYRVTFQAGLCPLGRSAQPLEQAIQEAQRALLAQQERVGLTAGAWETAAADRVLLVEDDPDFAALVCSCLRSAGIGVEHLATGAGALDKALELPASLVLLDGKLPDVSGFELLRRLRHSPPLREVPVALLTALSDQQDVVRGLELGADDYIVKPCETTELLARVRRLLRLRRPQEPQLGVGGLTGSFQGDQVVELLQMLGSTDKSGRLSIWGSASKGWLDLVGGKLVEAHCSSGRSGQEAAHELLLNLTGKFEFHPDVVAPPDQRSLNLAVGPLLMESMRRRDELGSHLGRGDG